MCLRLFSFLLIFCIYKSNAQNLLANGNFDDKNICIEFRAGCAPEAWFRVPLTPQVVIAEPGNKYVSVIMENISNPVVDRSFIYTRLLCSLDAGKKYRFKAWFRTNGNYPFDHSM